MRLNTVLPNGIVQTSPIEPGGFDQYEEWLHHLVATNPDVIFFYTVDSTDIFEDEEEI